MTGAVVQKLGQDCKRLPTIAVLWDEQADSSEFQESTALAADDVAHAAVAGDAVGHTAVLERVRAMEHCSTLVPSRASA
jgi:hypothetical protein